MRKARDFGTHPETETTTSDWGRRNPSTPKCCQCFGVKLPTGMQILQLQLGELPKVLMPRPDQILVPCSTSEKKINCFSSQQIPEHWGADHWGYVGLKLPNFDWINPWVDKIYNSTLHELRPPRNEQRNAAGQPVPSVQAAWSHNRPPREADMTFLTVPRGNLWIGVALGCGGVQLAEFCAPCQGQIGAPDVATLTIGDTSKITVRAHGHKRHEAQKLCNARPLWRWPCLALNHTICWPFWAIPMSTNKEWDNLVNRKKKCCPNIPWEFHGQTPGWLH